MKLFNFNRSSIDAQHEYNKAELKRVQEEQNTQICPLCNKRFKVTRLFWGNDPYPVLLNREKYVCNDCNKKYVVPIRGMIDIRVRKWMREHNCSWHEACKPFTHLIKTLKNWLETNKTIIYIIFKDTKTKNDDRFVIVNCCYKEKDANDYCEIMNKQQSKYFYDYIVSYIE